MVDKNSVKIISAEKIVDEIKEFRKNRQSLILSSCSKINQPLASYAPFVDDKNGDFYLLLSDMALHSTNLKLHNQQKTMISILLIEDENKVRNIFARKRLTYNCSVSLCARDNENWNKIIKSLKHKFGNTIDLLASLNDFSLYCLKPHEGRYVRGFGQAYELKGGVPRLLHKSG